MPPAQGGQLREKRVIGSLSVAETGKPNRTSASSEGWVLSQTGPDPRGLLQVRCQWRRRSVEPHAILHVRTIQGGAFVTRQ
jgi:hypothetical protein